MIRIRFVTCSDEMSAMIRWAEDFWASHVEAVLADGYLGAHADGGVQLRPVGYDKAILSREEFVELPCSDSQAAAWEASLRAAIGTPYDFGAILGIVVRANFSQRGHIICSALQMKKLIDNHFADGFPIGPEEVSPRDLRIFLAGK